MANTYTQILYHIIFSTKDRTRCITSDRRADLSARPAEARAADPDRLSVRPAQLNVLVVYATLGHPLRSSIEAKTGNAAQETG